MSEHKHTPGPWIVGISEDFSGWPMFRLRDMENSDPNAREAQANARLIAAAPDLLAACESALALLGNPGDDGPVSTALRAAIAKAVQP